MSRNLLQFLDLLLLFLGCMVIAVALSPQHGGEIGIVAAPWHYVTLVADPAPRVEVDATSSPDCTAFAWPESDGLSTLVVSAKWPAAAAAHQPLEIYIKGPVPAGLKGRWYDETTKDGSFTVQPDGSISGIADIVVRAGPRAP